MSTRPDQRRRLRGEDDLHGFDRERMALEVRRARGPFVVLLAFVVAAVAAALYIFSHLGITLPWQNTYTAHVALDNASGVVPGGDEVDLKGVRVGTITDVQLRNGQAVATITMDPKHGPLYRDARLELRPRTPLDDLYLDILSRGHPRAGKLGPNQVLPASQTQDFVEISPVLDVFSAGVRDRVKDAINQLGAGLPDHGYDLRKSLVELAPFLSAARRLTQVTAERAADTRQLIHNFGLMSGELARRDTQVRMLVRAGAKSLTSVGSVNSRLESVIAQLPPTMRQLNISFTTLRAAADQLDPAFDALQPTALALPAGLDALRRFSQAAAPSFEALRRPLPQLAALLSAVRPTAAHLAGAFAGLQPVAPRLDRITSILTPCELAVQKFFGNTISLTKFYDLRDFAPIIRGEVVLAGGTVPQPNQTWSPSCAPGAPGS